MAHRTSKQGLSKKAAEEMEMKRFKNSFSVEFPVVPVKDIPRTTRKKKNG